MIYIPIFKTKANVELKILSNGTELFKKNSFIPYLEIIHPERNGQVNKIVTKCQNALNPIQHFQQFCCKSFQDEFAMYTKFKDSSFDPYHNVIYSMGISQEELITCKSEVGSVIKTRRQRGLKSAVRIPSGTDINLVKEIINLLSVNDWLIIDLDEQEYEAAEFYLNAISDLQFSNTVVFSTERYYRTKNSDFPDYGYADDAKMNTSLIKQIKASNYPFHAFGTYMGLKNSRDDEFIRKTKCTALFQIYNQKKNEFYSIISDTPEYIAKVYQGKFKEKIRNAYTKGYLKDLFTHPSACIVLNAALSEKSSASKFLHASAVHYLEEIAEMRE